MATQEIESTKWDTFCKKFLELHRGTLMTVQHVTREGQTREIVRDMPLAGVWMSSEDCNDSIFLNFSEAGKREVTHQIIEPIHVKVREESEGNKGLQIEAENGATLVLFRSGKLEGLLRDLA
jgi:hypothetical protein